MANYTKGPSTISKLHRGSCLESGYLHLPTISHLKITATAAPSPQLILILVDVVIIRPLLVLAPDTSFIKHEGQLKLNTTPVSEQGHPLSTYL